MAASSAPGPWRRGERHEAGHGWSAPATQPSGGSPERRPGRGCERVRRGLVAQANDDAAGVRIRVRAGGLVGLHSEREQGPAGPPRSRPGTPERLPRPCWGVGLRCARSATKRPPGALAPDPSGRSSTAPPRIGAHSSAASGLRRRRSRASRIDGGKCREGDGPWIAPRLPHLRNPQGSMGSPNRPAASGDLAPSVRWDLRGERSAVARIAASASAVSAAA